MSNLLINESPLMVLPSLAEKIGLNEAIVLQQIHYLINSELNEKVINGKKWVYNTYEEWAQKFKFLSERTLQRTFLSLENLNLLIVGRFSKNSRDRTKWYTINYQALNSLDIGTTCQIGTMEHEDAKMAPSNVPDRHVPTCQIGTMSKVQENYLQKNTQEIFLKGAPTPQKKPIGAFEQFWESYPRKVGKEKARQAFHKHCIATKVPIETLLEALRLQKLEREERTRLGLFVPDMWPNPATWLNQHRWLDEVSSGEELKQEAQGHWKQKMSYRDMKNVEAEFEHNAFLQRMAERRAQREVIQVL